MARREDAAVTLVRVDRSAGADFLLERARERVLVVVRFLVGLALSLLERFSFLPFTRLEKVLRLAGVSKPSAVKRISRACILCGSMRCRSSSPGASRYLDVAHDFAFVLGFHILTVMRDG